MDLTALGSTPISDEQPTGTDARYETGFQDLQTEVGKLSTPPGIVDWEKVERLAAAILETKSKDLQAASYLAVALIHTRKAEGVAIGLTIYDDLLTTFWEDLFPKRKRGRSSAVEWWAERSDAAIKHIMPGISKADRDPLLERLNRIEDLLAEKLDEPPPLTPLRRTLRSLPSPDEALPPETAPMPDAGKASAPDTAPAPPAEATRQNPPEEKEPEQKAEAAPEAVPDPPGPQSQKASEAAIPPAKDTAEARKAIDAAYRQLQQAALMLRQMEPENPAAYRTNRIAAWAPVTGAPRQTNGRSQIPPPQTNTANRLRELRESGNWSGLLGAAEAELPRSVFWLDLNRFSCEAMSGSNGEKGFENARKTVEAETLSFIGRLRGLEKIAFADGTPFADEETRKWLDSLGGDALPQAADFTAQTKPLSPDAEQVTQAVEKGRALAEGNRLPDALAYFQRGIREAASAETKLVWRISLADLLIDFGQPELAAPHLQEILQTVEEHRLERWDPELTLAGLSVVWEGAVAGALPDRTPSEILARIAALDAAHALRLKTAERS